MSKEPGFEIAESPSSDASLHAEEVIQEKPRRKWQSYIWDTLDKSPEERKFLFKLDSAVITFACLGYFSMCALKARLWLFQLTPC